MNTIAYTATGIATDMDLHSEEVNPFLDWLCGQGVDLSGRDESYSIYGWSSLQGWYQRYLSRPINIGNAFSLNMLKDNATLSVVELDPEEVSELTARRPLESCIGHADTAAVVSSVLGIEVPANRSTLRLSKGDDLLVAQYTGPRLEEGTTRLPEGASITWKLVTVL